jgi:hypothetical protein
MRGRIYVICAAAFGGVLSNIVDLATRLQQQPPSLPSWTYWIGFFLWAACGAGVAAVWGERNLKRAFYLGIGLPAFIQLNVGLNPQKSNPADAYLKFLLPPALAQPSVPSVHGRELRVIRNENAPADGYSVVFLSPDVSFEETHPINFQRMPIPIPSYATRMIVQYQRYRSRPISLPREDHVEFAVEIYVRENLWSGFLQAIGRRDAPRYNVIVEPR